MKPLGWVSNPRIGGRWSAEHSVAAVSVAGFFAFAFVTGWIVGLAAARSQSY